MSTFKNYLNKLTGNVIVRNVVLAICAVIVFFFATNLLLNLFTRHNNHKQVPDFSNMSIEDARSLAKKSNLRIEINDSLYIPAFEGGTVLFQQPEPGTEVKSGRRIFLTVNSYRQRMVQIPYVSGVSLRQAMNNLEVAGLEVGRIVYKDDIATDYVLETRYDGTLITPGSQMEAEQGSGIMLVVGKRGEDSFTSVPKVVGFPAKEAKSRLWESGLNVADVVYDENVTLMNRNEARVYSQSPEQGSRLARGTNVTIRMTLDPDAIDKGSTESDRAAKRIIASQPQEEVVHTVEPMDIESIREAESTLDNFTDNE